MSIIKLHRKRMPRQYQIGQRIRRYQPWFNHNDIDTGWYEEGIIEQQDEDKRWFFRITKVVCDHYTIKESWKLGRTADFRTDDNFVFVLNTPDQIQMQLSTSKTTWQ